MKSSEAIKVLDCTRTSLSFYVRQGKIKVTELENGRYDYDDESVYALRNSRITRQAYLYMFTEPRYIDMGLQMARNSIISYGGSIDHTLIDTDRYKRDNLEQLIKCICLGRVSVVYFRRGDLIAEAAEDLFAMLCKATDTKMIILN